MSSKRACPAESRPGAGISVSARGNVGTYGPELSPSSGQDAATIGPRPSQPARPEYRGALCLLALCLLAPCLLGPTSARAAEPDTDTALWRAQHGLLLGIAHAGQRLVALGDAGHVLLSDDQGATWRLAKKSASDELLTSLVFPTPNEGWAVGQDETIMHSTDAGETWTRQYLKADADQVLTTIISLAPGHLFASGSYNLILETQDGTAWKESKIANLDDDYHLNCAVNRGDDILVTGEAGHAFIRYAGAWTPMKLPYDGSQFACLVGPDGSFYSFGLRGTAFRALPGARAWTKLDSGTERSFFGATNLANGQMALVGSNGLVELLDPATGKMTVLPRPTAGTLSGVTENKDGKLVIVGDDGVRLVDPAMAAGEGVSQ